MLPLILGISHFGEIFLNHSMDVLNIHKEGLT